MMKLSRNNQLLILFAAALVVRLVFVLTLRHAFSFDDEFEYYRMVENFLAGRGLAVSSSRMAFRPPLFPLLGTMFYGIPVHIVGFRIAQVLLSAATVVLIYLVGEKVFSRKTGWWAGIISVVYPFFIFYTGFFLTETLFVFLLVAALYYLCRTVSEQNPLVVVMAGVFFGLAGLTRPTIQMYVPLAGILLVCLPGRLMGKIKKALIMGAVCLAVTSPWIIRNYTVLHRFIPGATLGGRVFWEGNNPHSDGGPCSYFPYEDVNIPEVQRYGMLYGKTVDVLKENPRRALWLAGNKFLRFWNVVPNAAGYSGLKYRLAGILTFGVMLPFFLIGFCASFKVREAWFFHMLIVFFTLFHVASLASIRYRLPIEPFVIILAVVGFERAVAFARRKEVTT